MIEIFHNKRFKGDNCIYLSNSIDKGNLKIGNHPSHSTFARSNFLNPSLVGVWRQKQN